MRQPLPIVLLTTALLVPISSGCRTIPRDVGLPPEDEPTVIWEEQDAGSERVDLSLAFDGDDVLITARGRVHCRKILVDMDGNKRPTNHTKICGEARLLPNFKLEVVSGGGAQAKRWEVITNDRGIAKWSLSASGLLDVPYKEPFARVVCGGICAMERISLSDEQVLKLLSVQGSMAGLASWLKAHPSSPLKAQAQQALNQAVEMRLARAEDSLKRGDFVSANAAWAECLKHLPERQDCQTAKHDGWKREAARLATIAKAQIKAKEFSAAFNTSKRCLALLPKDEVCAKLHGKALRGASASYVKEIRRLTPKRPMKAVAKTIACLDAVPKSKPCLDAYDKLIARHGVKKAQLEDVAVYDKHGTFEAYYSVSDNKRLRAVPGVLVMVVEARDISNTSFSFASCKILERVVEPSDYQRVAIGMFGRRSLVHAERFDLDKLAASEQCSGDRYGMFRQTVEYRKREMLFYLHVYFTPIGQRDALHATERMLIP